MSLDTYAGSPVIHCLPEFAQICVHWVSDAVQPSHPLLPPPFDFNLSQHQGLFQWVSSSHQVADVLELQLSISPSSEYSGLISFRIGWFDLLTAQGTLKSLLQHHHSKASILQHSAFYGPTLTSVYDYWKTIALTIWNFVSKWCLCFWTCCLGWA